MSTEALSEPIRPRPRPSGGNRVLRSFMALVVMSLFVALPVLMAGKFTAWNALILIGLCILFTLICILRGEHVGTWFNAILVFLIVFPFFVQSLVQHSLIGQALGDLHIEGLTTMGLFVICLNLTYLFPTDRRRLILPEPGVRPWLGRLSAGGWKAFFVALGCFAAIMAIWGTEEIFLSRLRYIYGEAERLSATATFFNMILRLIPFWVLFFYVLHNQGRRSLNPFFLGAVVIAVIICNPTNTARFNSLFGVMLIFFGFLLSGRGLWFWKNSYVMAAFALLVLPLTSAMRGGTFESGIGAISQAFFGLEFSAITLLNDAFIIDFQSDALPVRLLTGILILVPRAIWEAKNTGTGIEVAEQAGYIFTNVGVPPVADAYFDFGYPGIVLLAVLCGWAYRRAARALTGQVALTSLSCGAALCLVGLTPILMRGDLSTFFIAFYASLTAFVIARAIGRVTFSGGQRLRSGVQNPS